MIKAAIHQPNFLPWIGYFHKISMVDSFVFFDDVQFPRGKTFGNRVKIKTNNGETWLTVPVLSKGEMVNFSGIMINNTFPWQRKIMKTIELSYGKARHFERYHDEFAQVFLAHYDKLIDLNTALIKFLSNSLELNVTFHLSSEINSDAGLNAEEKILNILRYLGATVYVSGKGAGSARYIDEERFKAENIEIVWQKFKSPSYPQLWGEFIPDLSVIDLIFNCGDKSSEILRQSQVSGPL